MIAKVNPSQRLNDKPHEAWVGVNKRTCAIVTAHCTCMAGYANNQKFCSFCAFVYLILTYVVDSEKSVSHVAGVLFKVEACIRLGIASKTCTSHPCVWNQAFSKKVL